MRIFTAHDFSDFGNVYKVNRDSQNFGGYTLYNQQKTATNENPMVKGKTTFVSDSRISRCSSSDGKIVFVNFSGNFISEAEIISILHGQPHKVEDDSPRNLKGLIKSLPFFRKK